MKSVYLRLQLIIAALFLHYVSNSQTLFGAATNGPGHESCDGVVLSSTGFSTYSGVSYPVPSGLTVSGLTQLATDYKLTEGGIGGGSPRFSVSVQASCGVINVWFYLGAPTFSAPADNIWHNTGNLADPSKGVDLNGCENAYQQSYATFQANHGSDPVLSIEFVADGGWATGGQQTLVIDNTNISGTLYGYDDCDDDGVPDAYDCDAGSSANAKWKVCHNGQSICVSQNALATHLAHGDVVGVCQTAARPITVINEQDAVTKNFSISTYPNPVSGTAKIQYSIPVDSKVNIMMYDVTGRELGALFTGDRKAGNYSIDYNTSKLGAGIYYCKMIATAGGEEFVQNQKMIKIK